MQSTWMEAYLNDKMLLVKITLFKTSFTDNSNFKVIFLKWFTVVQLINKCKVSSPQWFASTPCLMTAKRNKTIYKFVFTRSFFHNTISFH